MAIKKSELYSSLWKSCDELRGPMDPSQYKDYILVILFIKYISDKYANTNNPFNPITVPPGASFADMVALKGKTTIGDDINKKIIGKIAEANKQLSAITQIADFDNVDKLGSGKEKVDRLTNIIAIFQNPALDFSKNRAEGDDIIGDAYEYFMRNFATESGKSKGNFYTPAEVSRVIAKVISVDPHCKPSTTVYDPTCGSGSLLLKVAIEAEQGMSIYGQEIETSTALMATMNMVLHNNPGAVIEKGQSTLSNPLFKDDKGSLKTFDYVVANPPFSYKAWSNGLVWNKGIIVDQHDRFTDYGVPPKSKGDYAFLLHVIRSMKSKAKGAIILPHGVLFRGDAEAEIRKNIMRKGYIKGVIGLPPNLFFGTGIPACIIVLDKENAADRKGIFIIDASKGFIKDGNKNRLREQDIHKIVDVFNKQLEQPGYSRMVSLDEIEKKNDYNLNIPRYIDSQEIEDVQDIEAHLKGGLPSHDIDQLSFYWSVCPSLKDALFSGSSRKGYYSLKVAAEAVKPLVTADPEFVVYSQKINLIYEHWKKKHIPSLKNLNAGAKPRTVINTLSEDLLTAFSNIALLDKYDIYQHLMTYWVDIMQDDVYIIEMDGWKAELSNPNGKKGEWDCDLIPKNLLINRYFASEMQVINELEAGKDDLSSQVEAIDDDQSGEDGLLEEVKSDKGKVTKSLLQSRIKEIKGDKDYADELKVLLGYQKLMAAKADKEKMIKDATAALDKKVLDRYKTLTESETKTLVVDDKWMAAMDQSISAALSQISQRLTQRVNELAERYQTPLTQLIEQTSTLASKVDTHLEKMGFSR